MSHLRFSRRMGEQWPYGAEYGCSVTRYECKTPLATKALYIVAVLAFIVIYATA